jgi:hypothetical protein
MMEKTLTKIILSIIFLSLFYEICLLPFLTFGFNPGILFQYYALPGLIVLCLGLFFWMIQISLDSF